MGLRCVPGAVLPAGRSQGSRLCWRTDLRRVLSFLAPLVGLILYLIYRGSMPCRARGIKKAGLLGLGLSVLLVACIGVFAGGEIARQNEIREAQEAAEQARQRADDLHRQSQEIQEALENARRALESYYSS